MHKSLHFNRSLYGHIAYFPIYHQRARVHTYHTSVSRHSLWADELTPHQIQSNIAQRWKDKSNRLINLQNGTNTIYITKGQLTYRHLRPTDMYERIREECCRPNGHRRPHFCTHTYTKQSLTGLKNCMFSEVICESTHKMETSAVILCLNLPMIFHSTLWLNHFN